MTANETMREREILKEFELFFEHHLSGMTQMQLEEYERIADAMVAESRREDANRALRVG